MRRTLRFTVLAALLIPGSVSAQRPKLSADYLFKPGNVALTLSAGGAAFTDFEQDTEQNFGTRAAEARRVSAQTTATLGAAVSFWMSSRMAFQAEATYTPTRFRVTRETPGTSVDFDPADTVRYARLDLWSATGNLLLRPPISFGRLSPYAILGAGAVQFRVLNDGAPIPTEAQSRFAGGPQTQFLAVVGAGGLIPLQRRHMLLSFDITDHLTRTPLHDSTDGVTMTSNVRLAVGINIPLRLR